MPTHRPASLLEPQQARRRSASARRSREGVRMGAAQHAVVHQGDEPALRCCTWPHGSRPAPPRPPRNRGWSPYGRGPAAPAPPAPLP
eukprot:11595826-Alexandrium_andersonii.AAC.1